MNLWDSVHRGLEKASQEAGRIARMQRLRTVADGLARQMQGQHTLMVDRLMELFASGRLTQPEMLTLCQEFASMQQQMAQLQQELKQLQSASGPAGQPTGIAGASGEEPIAPVLPLSMHQATGEHFTPIPPPPPAEAVLTTSGLETVLNTAQADIPAVSADAVRYCQVCHVELLAGHAFCHQCGTAINAADIAPPTVRSGAEPIFSEETVRSQDVDG